LSAHRSQAFVRLNVAAGTQYWVEVADDFNGGGVTRSKVFYKPTAYQDDDLFLANAGIFVLRNGQLINYGGSWGDYAPTGIGIDYTKRPIIDIQDDSTHTGERVLLGLHPYELVEFADVYDLNRELDFIGDPWVMPGNAHPAQLQVTSTGLLYQAWFGNGYLYTSGSGTRPAFLNTVSNNASYSALKSIDAISGDSQPAAPYSDVERVLDIQVTAPWAIAFDETTGVLYYTSGGVYVPVGGDTIKRYDLNTNTQLADFATVPLQGTKNPGLKGLALLNDGGILVCNGTVVNRLNQAGVVTQTYTPSIAMDAQTLMDVVTTKDGTKFWVIDLWTTRLFQFDVASGAELQTCQSYGEPGSLVQMVLYRHPPAPPSPPVPRGPDPLKMHYYGYAGHPSGGVLGLAPGARVDLYLEQQTVHQTLGVKVESSQPLGNPFVADRDRFLSTYVVPEPIDQVSDVTGGRLVRPDVLVLDPRVGDLEQRVAALYLARAGGP